MLGTYTYADQHSNLYRQAAHLVGANGYDQAVEDEIDELMAKEHDDYLAEQAEIDALVYEDDLYNARQSTQLDVTASEFTEFAIKIPVAGQLKQFSFDQREYLKPIYNTEARRTLLKCGRQTEKSTTLGNRTLSYTAINMAFKTLFVSATAQQAQVFSVDRIKDPLELSPELQQLTDSKLNQNVFFKQFRNRSQIRIRYAFLSADRTRGIPADLINIDEIQDIITENIPVIEQCAFHSPWKLFCYSGTPKSLDNTIEVYWSDFSTQNEWVVPCERHGTPKRPDSWHWNVLGSRNIGLDGLVCARCSKPINPRHPMAQWVSLQPVTEDNKHRVTFEGYRIPQIMVPWVDWTEILTAREHYPTVQFNNEVLGLSYDSGARPLTRAQVKSVCREDIHFSDLEENARRCHGHVFAGLDWGTGEAASYTVLSLGGYMDHGFQIFYLHRFTGDDLEPMVQLDKISRLLVKVGFTLIGSDYGGGFDRNDWLMRNFGPHRLFKFAYSAQPKQKVKWQPTLGRFILHRTEIMSDIFNAIKAKKIWLPNWEEMLTPHGEDMLNIFSEFNNQLRMIQYKNSPGKADDTFHSILYCLLASMMIKPRPDLLIPTRAGDVDFDVAA